MEVEVARRLGNIVSSTVHFTYRTTDSRLKLLPVIVKKDTLSSFLGPKKGLNYFINENISFVLRSDKQNLVSKYEYQPIFSEDTRWPFCYKPSKSAYFPLGGFRGDFWGDVLSCSVLA